jgi:eukaryotic-like serine/threonine-protein kinase
MTGRFPRQFGKYVLLKPLAKGGMGEIYLAAGGEVGGFEKLCVIKKVITEKADKTKANRFLDEAKVVLRLAHSALVNTFDAGEVGGEFYIAMELVEGKDLREVWNRCVRTRQRIPLDVALHVVREVARALAYVHGYGDLKLVHRDVAPPNILLAYVGDVKLTDFGLARSVLKQEHTAPGVVFGRAAYLSPEQARGEMADARTDVYTLGIVLWELLTGQQFLQLGGLDPAAALALVRHPKLIAPSTRAPWITPTLDQVALRALAPDRDKRFQSAEELRQALTTVIAEMAPTADSSRVADFLNGIYADTIAEERGERERFLKEEIPNFRAALARGVRLSGPEEGRPSQGDADTDAPARPAGDAAGGHGGRGGQSGQGGQAGQGGHGDHGGYGDHGARSTRSSRASRGQGRRPSAPRLPGMPEPTTTDPKAGDAANRPAPAFLSAFRAESVRPNGGPARPAAGDGGKVGKVDDRPGEAEATTLAGRFRLLRLLGESAGEALHAASDQQGDAACTVHLYRLPPPAGGVDAWKKTARAAARVRHARVAELVEVAATDDGRALAVHEALDGLDLGTLLAREQRLEPGAAVGVARQVGEALVALHAGGVVHGALRPGAVFLHGPAHAVKLLGFGLGRLVGLDEKPEAALAKLPSGMIEYLGPELMRGVTGDARADLYGLGALLYEMVTGVPPYAGSREAVERKKQTPPQSPRLFRPDLSADLEQLILRLLDPEPGKRPASAGEASAALEALAGTLGPSEIAPSSHKDDERRRVRREAAFRAISDLASEATGGPQLLEGQGQGQDQGQGDDQPRTLSGIGPSSNIGPAARSERRAPRRTPPPPPAAALANGNGAAHGALAVAPALATAPLPAFAPPPHPVGRKTGSLPSGPSVITSALSPPAPAPALGGAVLARYGVAPAASPGGKPRRRVRLYLMLALVAATAALAIKVFSGPRAPAPAADHAPGK